MGFRRALLGVLTPAVLTACGDGTIPEQGVAGLPMARALWEARGPSSYSFTVLRSCECLPGWTGPVNVVVSDGVVRSRAYTVTAEPVPADRQGLFPDVAGLFRMIEDASRAGAAWIEVIYDPGLGYPRRMVIDDDGVFGNDDELIYTTSAFDPH